MRERNGILLAGKRVLFTIVIGLLCSLSLSADYKLVLTDVDGNQTQECVKSYSFSNNLESIANQNALNKDVYSEKEVITNKIFMDKFVYRKVINLGIINTKETILKHNISNLDRVINSEVIRTSYGQHYNDGGAYWANENAYNFVKFTNENVIFKSSAGVVEKPLLVIMEYTKTTDVANSSPNKFQSYLHYKLSSTTNDEVITKDMENLGVQLLKGYSYDASTNSCTKN